jgi:hypothetical protein
LFLIPHVGLSPVRLKGRQPKWNKTPSAIETAFALFPAPSSAADDAAVRLLQAFLESPQFTEMTPIRLHRLTPEALAPSDFHNLTSTLLGLVCHT